MARRAYLYSTSLVLRWMVRLNIGVLLLVFAASPIVVPVFFNIARAAGNTYYVDCNRPDDTGNGTSAGTAWKTINKVNTSSFSAGDSVLFNKGCTWREQLDVPSSGSAGSPITFGAYGSGAKPVINGSNLVTGWTQSVANQETGGLFASGMETASLADWTSVVAPGTTVAQQSTTAKDHGTYGLLVTGDGTNRDIYVSKTFTTISSGTAYARFYFQVPTGTGLSYTSHDLATIQEADGTAIAGVEIDELGSGMYLRYIGLFGAYPVMASSAAGTIVEGTWYYVDVSLKIDASVGGGQMWLSGTSKGSNFVQNTSAFNIGRVAVGWNPGVDAGATPGNGKSLWFDDVKVDTTGPIGAYNAPANTYQAADTTQPYTVAYNGTWLAQDVGATTGVGSNKWDWAANVLYVNVGGDPTGNTVEAGARDYAVSLNGKTYITIQNLEIDGANSANLIAYGNSDHLSVLNNTVKNGGTSGFTAGISLDGSSNSLIQGNTVSYDYIGIQLSGWGPATTASNLVRLNTTSHTGNSGIAIAKGGGTGPANNTIEFNDVSYSNQSFDDSAGIYPYAVGTGNIIRYNRIHSGGTATTRTTGIQVDDASSPVVAYGNVIYLNSNGCISATDTGHLFYNNTCYHNNEYGYDIGELNLFALVGTGGNTFKNNIAVASTGKHLVQVNTGSTTSDVFNYNLYYGGSATPYYWGGTSYNLADYKTASSQDGNSPTPADPLFTNAAGGDFTLQSGSPAIDAGTNLGSPYNMGLDPRTSFPWSTLDQGIYGSWDIGAFVYVPNLGSGNQTEPRYDFLNNSALSATSNHTLVFTVLNSLDNTGGSASDTLAFTFQSNFNLGSITCGDVNVATGTRFLFNVSSPEPRTNCPNTTTSWGLLIDPSTRTITITVPKNVQTYVATGTILTVSIGANANYQNQGTHWIVNPTDSGTKSITIGGTFGGSGQILVSINTAVQLSASIGETLNLTLTGLTGSGTGGMNSCSSDGTHDAEDNASINLINTTAASVPIGTLNTANTFYEGCQKVSVTTNAGNGFTVAVREDHSLRTASGLAIADTGCDSGNCLNTPSTAAAWVANTNSGLGISCAQAATSASCWTANPNWINGTRWAPIASEGTNNPTGGTQTPAIFSGLSSATGVEVITKAKYRVTVPTSQPAGAYTNQVSFIATPVF